MIEFSCLAVGIIVFAVVREGLLALKDVRTDLNAILGLSVAVLLNGSKYPGDPFLSFAQPLR